MDSPFKFLDAYEQEDVEQFFGREKETGQLYNAVFSSNLTLLYGASGTGKTSLIRCGLADKFYDSDWLPLFIRRGQDLNRSLSRSIRQALERAAPEHFSRLSITEQVQQLYWDHYRPIYLIFDQFEELYVHGSAAEQETFYQTIARLLTSGLQAKVLIVIREEWIAYLDAFERMVPGLFENRLRIERMNDRNIFRVIGGTARYHGIPIEEPALTIRNIIDNLRDRNERVDLTNLQVYLDRLWRTDIEQNGRRAEKVALRPSLVRQVGKLDNVLALFLVEQMEQLEEKLRAREVSHPEGLPLEILFALVSEEQTKSTKALEEIRRALPEDRRLSEANLRFCLKELQRIKIIRPVE